MWLSTIRDYGIGHTGDYFSIPCGDGYQLRKDPDYCYGDEPKYLTPRGQPALIIRPSPEGKPTVVCEGPLDALLLSQFGYDAVTSTGGAGSLIQITHGSLSGLLSRRRVYVATDIDDAGEEAAASLASAFRGSRRVTWEGGKDISEALVNIDPAYRGSWLQEVFSL